MNSPTSWMRKGSNDSDTNAGSAILRKAGVLPPSLDSGPRKSKRGSVGPSDKMVVKARISAKRASVAKLTVRMGGDGAAIRKGGGSIDSQDNNGEQRAEGSHTQ